jgi:hypothetical protein
MQLLVQTQKDFEFGLFLRRAFWQPLRRMMAIFHILPLTAALFVFLVFAINGQLREVYLSYLENVSGAGQFKWQMVIAGIAATIGLALLSAVLYGAHYELSTMRINVIYSNYSSPESGTRIRGLQRTAAIILAFVPWLGVSVGLFGTRSYLIQRYNALKAAGVDAPELASMQPLLAPHVWEIALAALALGLSAALFLNAHRHNRTVQWLGIVFVPAAAAVLLVLLVESTPAWNREAWRIMAFVAAVFWMAVGAALYLRPPMHAITTAGSRLGLGAYLYKRPLNVIFWLAQPRQRRRGFFFVWALLPWLAIAALFLVAPAFKIAAPGRAISNSPGHSWAMIPTAMAMTLAGGLFVAHKLDQYRASLMLKWAIIASILALLLVSETAGLHIEAIIFLYQSAGPLATIAFELLFLISALGLLAWLSQKSGFPALALVTLAMIVSAVFPIPIAVTVGGLTLICVLLAIMAALSQLYGIMALALILTMPGILNVTRPSDVVKPFTADPHHPDEGRPLVERFQSWLKQPGRKRAGSTPVFIFAVEGGGIYAATAASLFLAELQDEAPCFSRHVFAISGVSGGAIGASVFQALDRSALGEAAADARSPAARSLAASNSQDCPSLPVKASDPSATGPLERKVTRIMLDDHLSPIVASIFTEQLFGVSELRAKSLAQSFQDSVAAQDKDAARALGQDFGSHWSAAGAAPALVLNTTWVETGYRVAFAPFALHDPSQREANELSLYSFSDQNMPGDGKTALMQAAVDSARFPGMLPARSIKMDEAAAAGPDAAQASAGQTKTAPDRPPSLLLWNFVDGGYSDNSGASTALALYKAIEPIASSENVELHLVLLTNSATELVLTPGKATLNGTPFRDTLAPINAIMNIRQGLSNEAVARVGNFFHDRNHKERAGHLHIIELDGQTFDLPLGWELSQTTFHLISWMLGRPEPPAPGPAATSNKTQEPAATPAIRSASAGPPNEPGLLIIMHRLLQNIGLEQRAASTGQSEPTVLQACNRRVREHIEALLGVGTVTTPHLKPCATDEDPAS